VADFPQTVPAEPAPEVAPTEASNVSPAMTPVENLKPSGNEPDVQSGQRRYRGHGRGHRRAWTPPIAAAEAMPTEAVSQVAFVPSPLPKPRAARPSPTTGETLSSSGWLALIAAALALAGLVTVFVRRERIIARKRPIAKMAARLNAAGAHLRSGTEAARTGLVRLADAPNARSAEPRRRILPSGPVQALAGLRAACGAGEELAGASGEMWFRAWQEQVEPRRVRF
jgi:hypothetical protein